MYYRPPVTRDSSVTYTIHLISWIVAVRVCNHSIGGASRCREIMHIIAYTGGAPAHYLDRQAVMHAPGEAQLGNPDWICQQAASRSAGVASSVSPWTIKATTHKRVKHQEGRGHLPLRAEVQACSSRVQVGRRAGTHSDIHIGHPCGIGYSSQELTSERMRTCTYVLSAALPCLA